MLRLPPNLVAQGAILTGDLYDALPVVPKHRYELLPYDPITTRLIVRSATTAIRCPNPPPAALPTVWVLGFESPRKPDPLVRGIWHVVRSSDRDSLSLYAMSRDLWGARAFVTAMRLLVFTPDSAAKR